MKKLLLASAAVPLIPGVVGAATMRCFFGFTPERMAYSPEPCSFLIAPHPQSGGLRGTFAPENECFPIAGRVTVLSPEEIGRQEESWGAIESLYR